MKVVCVNTYDDDGTQVVLYVPDGKDGGGVFVDWLRKTNSFYKDASHKQCLEAECYLWEVHSIEGFPVSPAGNQA